MHGAQRMRELNHYPGFRDKAHDAYASILDFMISELKTRFSPLYKDRFEFVLYKDLVGSNLDLDLSSLERMTLLRLMEVLDGWLCYDSGERKFMSLMSWSKKFDAWEKSLG